MRPHALSVQVRWLAFSEVTAAIAAFHFCTWVLAPRVASAPAAWIFLATLVLFATYPLFVSGRVWRRLGAHSWVRMPWPAASELTGDARFYAPLTLSAGLLVVLLSLVTNPGWQGVDAEHLVRGLVRYIGLAATQAFFYFVFILPRLAAALQSRDPADHRVWMVMAAIFAVCHLPNAPLMVLSALIAIGWTWLYRHRPNPVMVCVSHALLGTLLAEVAQLHMRVGVAYSTPEFRPLRVALRTLFGDVVPMN